MEKLEQLLDKYNEPYDLDDRGKTTMKRQKIRLEAMKLLPDLLDEMKELNALFDKQHERTKEATKLWQERHVQPNVIPDLGELIGWLLMEHKYMSETIVSQAEESGMKGIQIETLLNTLKEAKDALNYRFSAEDAVQIIDQTLEDWGMIEKNAST